MTAVEQALMLAERAICALERIADELNAIAESSQPHEHYWVERKGEIVCSECGVPQ